MSMTRADWAIVPGQFAIQIGQGFNYDERPFWLFAVALFGLTFVYSLGELASCVGHRRVHVLELGSVIPLRCQ